MPQSKPLLCLWGKPDGQMVWTSAPGIEISFSDMFMAIEMLKADLVRCVQQPVGSNPLNASLTPQENLDANKRLLRILKRRMRGGE